MGKQVEITSQVISLSARSGLVFMLLKRGDLPDISNHVKPKESMSFESIMGSAQQMAARVIKESMPIQDMRDKISIPLTKEEYEKIGSPHIGSQITIRVSMEGE